MAASPAHRLSDAATQRRTHLRPTADYGVAGRRTGLASLSCNHNITVMKAYEEVAEFIARRDPREVVQFCPSEQSRQRASELLQKEKTKDLSIEERRELDHYENLEMLMNLARAYARKLLLHEPSGQ